MLMRTARIRIAFAVFAVCLIATMARGDDASEWQFQQFMPGGMMNMWNGRSSGFRPPIAQRDLDAIADSLELDEGQRAALADLNQSLIDEFKIAWVSYREARVDSEIAEEAESGEQGYNWGSRALGDLEKEAELRHEQDRLVEVLFTDLRLLLTPEQEKRWASAERDRRRASVVGEYALYDEEALDLVSIAKGLELTADQRKAIGPMLEQYADQLDVLLADRARTAEKVGEAGLAFFRDEQRAQSPKGDNADEVAEVMKFWQERQERAAALVPDALELRGACEKVRDCNIRYIGEIGELLPESAREAWAKATSAKRAPGYGKAQNLSRTMRSIRLLQELQTQIANFESWAEDSGGAGDYLQIMRGAEPLTAEQRQSLTEITDRVSARAEAIVASHASDAQAPVDGLSLQTPKGTMVLQRVDASNTSRRVFYGGAAMQQPSQEVIKEIRLLDQETLAELRAILTINQRAAICMW